MKKKNKLVLAIAAFTACFLGIGAIAYAVWVKGGKSAENTVTIGSPITVSLSSVPDGGTTLDPQGTVTFTVKAQSSDVSQYAFVQITSASINGGAAIRNAADTDNLTIDDIWQYQVGESGFTSFTQGTMAAEIGECTANDIEIEIELTVKLDIANDADAGYAGTTLVFTVELVETQSQ
ncbi:MAG: hypothetical protein LBL66_00305 [Clostridiales bacterium]|jgi:hypothetical protein|nr:hypothetical protein [Clostridiales bacterium]